MRRASWVALVVVPLVTMPTWVHAAPPCGDPILKRHCIYLPSAVGPNGRGCERITGDAFDDSTAWRLMQPAKGTAKLETDAALTGGVGLRLEPDPDSFDDVGAQSTATARRRFGAELWMTFWYREAEAQPRTPDRYDGLDMCVIPSSSPDAGFGSVFACWTINPQNATSAWTAVVENMDEEAKTWTPDELRVSIEADGGTVWDVDDVALWSCKPGERPR